MPDYLAPFIQGFGIGQRIQQLQLEKQQAQELNAYRQQLAQQQAQQTAIQGALGFLREGNLQAAQALTDQVGLGVKLQAAPGGKGAVAYDRNGNAWLVNPDPNNPTLTPFRAEGPAAVVGTLPNANVMAQGEGPISEESILPQPKFPVPGQAQERPHVISPGAALVGSEGNVIYQAPGKEPAPQARSVGPGSALVDPATGKVIYQAPPAPRSEGSRAPQTGQLIARLQKTRDQLMKDKPFFTNSIEGRKWKKQVDDLDRQIKDAQAQMTEETGGRPRTKDTILEELKREGLFK